ncbi:cobaltochelatase CobT-related protein [Sutterella wadsworthensis]|uniref:cobaltochelatase CobT-related protein n=1 Tax=Sutterella wadsworthensis TaxID=40545 RepID=UPI003AB33CA1
MNIEVNALRRAVEPLTHMMSGLGLKVSFQGSSALTEFDPDTGVPKRVVLPMIPGDADPDLISAFHGYLDHEVAHCMYTKLSKNMLKECENSTLQTIHNMVEDARIEKLMCRRFRGSAFNFQKLREKVFPPSNFILTEEGNFAEYQRFMQALLYSIRALSGQEYFQESRKVSKRIDALCNYLDERFGDRLRGMETTEDSFELAKDIIKDLDLKLSEQPASKGKGEGEKEESSESEKHDEGQFDGEDPEGIPKALIVDKTADPTTDFFKSNVKNTIVKDAAKLIENLEYSVYSTDADRIEYAPESTDFDTVQRIEDATRGMTAPIQKNLERAIAARSIAVWNTGLRSGRLHNAALGKLITGDERVFRRKKEETETKNVAVSLVIDCSGSMRGSSSRLACTSAYALANVLTRMNIAFEIIGFTTAIDRPVGSYKKRFSRYEPLYLPIFKGFNDKWDSRAKMRLGQLASSSFENLMRNNIDGESIQICGDRLLSRPEKGKIMIVLSDGFPAADGDREEQKSHLKAVVENLEKRMKIVGIGIDSTAVRSYYSKNVVIYKLEELPGQVVQELRKALLS